MTSDPANIPDEELARQTQAGSLVAFEELVYRYERRVLAFVNQFRRNATDARELTQDTFVRAFRSIDQFDARRDFSAWLFTIAHRKCIDQYRANPPVEDGVIPETPDESNPADIVSRREDGRDLWRLAREQLKDDQFMALWLHYAEDMEIAQIARVLGKTRIHIKVLLFRARQVLGRELNPALVVSRAVPDSVGHGLRSNKPSTKTPPPGKISLSRTL